MSNVIKIDDGFKTFDIVNMEGKLLGQFSFNPSDTNIIKRHKEVIESLEKIFSEIPEDLKEENINDELINVEKIVCEKIDYLLNTEAAEEFFSVMGPFSPLESGQFFVESVINAIGQAISVETGERVKKINSKIKKHTSKYHG